MFFILGQGSGKARRARMHACRLALGGRGPVGPGSKVCILLARAVSRGLNLESNAFGSLLLLADNYNPTTDDRTIEAQSAQRTHRDILAERSYAVSSFRSLRATGSSAGQPQGRGLRRSCPGCARGAGQSGLEAMSSGRAVARLGMTPFDSILSFSKLLIACYT